MRTRPQYIASFVTGCCAALALFAVLYSGMGSTQAVRNNEATLDASSVNVADNDTGGRLGEIPPAFDLGLIGNEETTAKTFKVANVGSGKLRIKDVRTSCGCTKGFFLDRNGDPTNTAVIPPGASEELQIAVDPFKVPGFSSTKTLTLFTNDPEKPAVSMDVIARVKPEFEVEPEQLHLGEVDQGDEATGTAIIREVNQAGLEIAGVRPGPRATDIYTVALAERAESEWKTAGKREWELSVAMDTSTLRKGLFRDRVYLETNAERLPNYGFYINVDVKTFVSVIPQVLHRRDPVAPGTKSVTSGVVNADKPIRIENLTSSDPAIVVSVLDSDGGNSRVLDVSVADNATPGVKNSEVAFDVIAEDGQRSHQSVRAIVAVRGSP
jgi:hypothetical protein